MASRLFVWIHFGNHHLSRYLSFIYPEATGNGKKHLLEIDWFDTVSRRRKDKPQSHQNLCGSFKGERTLRSATWGRVGCELELGVGGVADASSTSTTVPNCQGTAQLPHQIKTQLPLHRQPLPPNNPRRVPPPNNFPSTSTPPSQQSTALVRLGTNEPPRTPARARREDPRPRTSQLPPPPVSSNPATCPSPTMQPRLTCPARLVLHRALLPDLPPQLRPRSPLSPTRNRPPLP